GVEVGQKTAGKLVELGLACDRRLRLDAIEPAYNATACRPGVHAIRGDESDAGMHRMPLA
ncbi:hypothetical protein, partial [Burkholderia cenocepacia]|uniref:hypothetical protein n=1 Tax=Burkholderia cenocepacia TaxID=95486 RepID=UPI00406D1DDC